MTKLVALWVTRVAVAGMFLLVGGSKLAGAPDMVALFDAIGIGQWFRYVTGSIEVVSAVALLVPSLAPFGALLLVPTMVARSPPISSSSAARRCPRPFC